MYKNLEPELTFTPDRWDCWLFCWPDTSTHMESSQLIIVNGVYKSSFSQTTIWRFCLTFRFCMLLIIQIFLWSLLWLAEEIVIQIWKMFKTREVTRRSWSGAEVVPECTIKYSFQPMWHCIRLLEGKNQGKSSLLPLVEVYIALAFRKFSLTKKRTILRF